MSLELVIAIPGGFEALSQGLRGYSGDTIAQDIATIYRQMEAEHEGLSLRLICVDPSAQHYWTGMLSGHSGFGDPDISSNLRDQYGPLYNGVIFDNRESARKTIYGTGHLYCGYDSAARGDVFLKDPSMGFIKSGINTLWSYLPDMKIENRIPIYRKNRVDGNIPPSLLTLVTTN